MALVSRSLADRFWPGNQAVGKRLKRGAENSPWSEVVGVVEDVRDVGLDLAPADTVYTPYLSRQRRAGAGQPGGADARRSARIDPGDPSRRVGRRSQSAARRTSSRSRDFSRTRSGRSGSARRLISACGLIGLLLATIGTYGVTARSVVERTKEVGVRLALGGRPRTVWWAVASTSIRAILAGAVAGVALSAMARAGLAALLPELQGASLAFSFAAAAVLLAVGALAAVLASRRATSIDPLIALRSRVTPTRRSRSARHRLARMDTPRAVCICYTVGHARLSCRPSHAFGQRRDRSAAARCARSSRSNTRRSIPASLAASSPIRR